MMNRLSCLIPGLGVCGIIMVMSRSLFLTWEIQAIAAVTVLMIMWWITAGLTVSLVFMVPVATSPSAGAYSTSYLTMKDII